jgi:hypothetical protein
MVIKLMVAVIMVNFLWIDYTTEVKSGGGMLLMAAPGMVSSRMRMIASTSPSPARKDNSFTVCLSSEVLSKSSSINRRISL